MLMRRDDKERRNVHSTNFDSSALTSAMSPGRQYAAAFPLPHTIYPKTDALGLGGEAPEKCVVVL